VPHQAILETMNANGFKRMDESAHKLRLVEVSLTVSRRVASAMSWNLGLTAMMCMIGSSV